MTGYYREFVERYSHISKPLTQLLQEDIAWEWTPPCQLAFDRLKELLTTPPVLSPPDPHRPYYLHTDYSHVALGAVLEQLKEDGKRHVVSYASRTCSAAESKLGPTDGELLAIVYAVEKFHHHLAGTPFTVITDHSALVTLNESKTKNPKLARWAMKLAGYNFTIQHRPGRIHNNADGLSRSRATPAPDTPPPDVIALEETTLEATSPALTAALAALQCDPHIDGDPPTVYLDEIAVAPTLGPRQLLMEQAPCHRCNDDIPSDSATGIICDRCNRPFHLRCLDLTATPPTSWYCPTCSSHIQARGITCPTEDLELQLYLLGTPPPPHLAANFTHLA